MRWCEKIILGTVLLFSWHIRIDINNNDVGIIRGIILVWTNTMPCPRSRPFCLFFEREIESSRFFSSQFGFGIFCNILQLQQEKGLIFLSRTLKTTIFGIFVKNFTTNQDELFKIIASYFNAINYLTQ